MRSTFISLLLVTLLNIVSPATALGGDISESAVRTDVGGFMLNSIMMEPGNTADLPPIVFIHGASASLYDPIFSFRKKLQGRAELLFVDRPGHGDSDAGGSQNILPDGQADAIAVLMKKRGIRAAIIVGHSFGGAITAAFAVRHPEMVLGLVFLSPAAYPWDGSIEWYYRVASTPVLGQMFSTLVAPPVGLFAIDRATREVFAPNARPDNYVKEARALQAVRPAAFRHNAREIAALNAWAKKASPAYRNIDAPTIIITGDTDEIVSPEIHSRQLARDISNSKLIIVRGLGHKSDYVARDLAVASIEKLAGKKVNLVSIAKSLERSLAADAN